MTTQMLFVAGALAFVAVLTLVAVAALVVATGRLRRQVARLPRVVRALAQEERALGDDLSVQRMGPLVAELVRHQGQLQQELRLVAQGEQARAERYRRHAEELVGELAMGRALVTELRALLEAERADRGPTEPGAAPVAPPTLSPASTRPPATSPGLGRAPLASSVVPRPDVPRLNDDGPDDEPTMTARHAHTMLPPAQSAVRGAP